MRTNFFTKLSAVAVIALLMCSTISFAGDLKGGGDGNGRFSAGLELALPNGSFGDGAGTGFGVSLRYEMPLSGNLALMATAGYLTFGSKTVSSGDPALIYYSTKTTSSMIPVQVGAKYYFTEQQKGFYGALHVGIHSLSTKVDETITIANASTTSSATGSNTGFSYAPEIGYHLDNLDFGLRFQLFSFTSSSSYTDPFTGITTTTSATASGSYIGVRAAYVFGSK